MSLANRSGTADPQTLRAFVALAREGSVSRAAMRLHPSRPAVSLRLQSLAQISRDELDVGFCRVCPQMLNQIGPKPGFDMGNALLILK
jgi:hypothetical protein